MRKNMNWSWMIGLALCVLAALLYFMMQSDFMKKQSIAESVATENVATSVEADGYPGEEEDMYPGEEDFYPGEEDFYPGEEGDIYPGEWEEEPSMPGNFYPGEDWENEGYPDYDDNGSDVSR